MLLGASAPPKASDINLGLRYSPHKSKLSRQAIISSSFAPLPIIFSFLRFYQIRHFGLPGQHGVQIFTADVERGVSLGLQCFTVVKHAIVNVRLRLSPLLILKFRLIFLPAAFALSRRTDIKSNSISTDIPRSSIRGTGGAVAELSAPLRAALSRRSGTNRARWRTRPDSPAVQSYSLADSSRPGHPGWRQSPVQQFCRPAVITLLVRFLRQVDDTARTTAPARNVYPSPT